MEKLRIRQAFFLTVFFVGLLLFQGKANAAEAAVSQTDIYLPDMVVYLSTEDGKAVDKESAKIKLPDTETSLTIKSSDILKDTDRGIFYHILLDVSGSVSESQLADMKTSVKSLRENLREQDKLELITFGGKTKVVLEGGESVDEVKNTLDGIGKEKNTHLYEAIDVLTAQIEKQQDKEREEGTAAGETMRNVGVILTDWQEVKDAGGVTSQEESLLALQKTGTPLYGYCLKTASVKLQDEMGGFLRKTGGSFHLYEQKNKKTELTDLNERLLADNVLVVSASSNRIYEEAKVLKLEIDGKPLEKENVYLNAAKEDDKQPEIVSVVQAEGAEAKTIVVTFSEDVLHADNKNNYSILKDGKQTYTVSEATYTSDDETYQARLVLNDKLVKGTYEVRTDNITDNTNEENELTGSWEGALDGEGALKALCGKLGKYWAVILAAVILIVLLLIYLYIKKHRGILVMEDKLVLGDNVQQKQHIKSDAASVKDVVLSIGGVAAEEKQIAARINGSVTIGRNSKLCDIYFDDILMSRQHFALSVENGEVFVTDLESSGGTFVNGQKLAPLDAGKVKIESGSEVEAGSVTFVIAWQEGTGR